MIFDLEKAFDTIDWTYMMHVLQRMGFGPTFPKWISLLYEHPEAALRINSRVSDVFPVSRGTRQGCPLSPGLFTPVMEPLALVLRSDPQIQGIGMGTLTETTPLYVDNLVLFIGDTGPSLQAALSLSERFSVVSGLKVNWTKCKILALRSHPMSGQADPNNPLEWVTQIKYLGLILNSVTDNIGLNIPPLLATLNRKLNT